MSWFVLSVKRGQERKVAETLSKMHVEVFNPTVKEVKYWSDRTKVVDTPLFSSYVFVNLSEKYRGLVFGAEGVKSYLFLKGKPSIVPNKEINTIKQWIHEDNYDLVLLSKLISRNEIGIQDWLLQNNSGVKWIGKSNVSQLIEEMDDIIQNKLRDVV